MYSILYEETALRELEALRPHEARWIVDEVGRHLAWEPLRPTRAKKRLTGLLPPWVQVRPVWRLRVGDFRVFYDADERGRAVTIHAVRRKGTRTTEEIL